MALRIWWSAWGDFVQKSIALLSSYASLVGLLFVFLPKPEELPFWALLLIAISIVGVAILLILEFLTRRRLSVYANSDSDGIRDYMHTWIEHGGVVAIWTRDLTWANNQETRKLLKEKAKRDELILCLPTANDLTNELRKSGATICAYGSNLLDSPSSRFTIAFYGKDGARVAVGRPDGDVHIIEEFGEGGHPAFALAKDLVELVRSIGQSGAA